MDLGAEIPLNSRNCVSNALKHGFEKSDLAVFVAIKLAHRCMEIHVEICCLVYHQDYKAQKLKCGRNGV